MTFCVIFLSCYARFREHCYALMMTTHLDLWSWVVLSLSSGAQPKSPQSTEDVDDNPDPLPPSPDNVISSSSLPCQSPPDSNHASYSMQLSQPHEKHDQYCIPKVLVRIYGWYHPELEQLHDWRMQWTVEHI